jgi:hypothetical protein
MGRHAGFLTAASALGKKFPDDGPHLIYLPERVFSVDKFLMDVKATYEKYGRCVIAASEGIHDEKGTPIITQLASQVEHDAHGNVQLSGTGALADLLCDQIKEKLKHQARPRRYLRLSATLVHGLCFGRRSARSAGSRRKGRAIRNVGRQGRIGRDQAHRLLFRRLSIGSAGASPAKRVMEDEFIAASGTDVTDAFRLYLRPLLGSGMPDAYRLRLNKVAKILKQAPCRPLRATQSPKLMPMSRRSAGVAIERHALHASGNFLQRNVVHVGKAQRHHDPRLPFVQRAHRSAAEAHRGQPSNAVGLPPRSRVAKHHVRTSLPVLSASTRATRSPTPPKPLGMPDFGGFEDFAMAMYRLGAFGHHHQRVHAALVVAGADLGRHLVDIEGNFGNQDRVGAAGNAGVQGDPSGIAPHDLDHHHALMAFRRAVQAIKAFGGKATAVSKPKVVKVLSRSLSMVLGTPTTRSPF